LAAFAFSVGLHTLAVALMFLPFIFSGVYGAAGWIGYINYLIEIVPVELRPTYTGLMNTAMAVTSLLPVVGGLLVQVLGYQVTFAVTLATTAAGLLLTSTMVEPRAVQPEHDFARLEA